MKEIEVKAHLKNKDEVKEKLNALGCEFSQPIKQTDVVYAKVVSSLPEFLKNEHFLRIRERSDGKYIFTVKQSKSHAVLTKSEHETEILDKEELEKALFLMGYKIANQVVKVRQTAQYKDFEICLDEVEELGSFIEVEKMSDGDVDEVRRELNEFLLSLNVAKEDEVHKGYDIMAMEKNI